MLTVACPGCDRRIQVPDKFLAHTIECAQCHTRFTSKPASAPTWPRTVLLFVVIPFIITVVGGLIIEWLKPWGSSKPGDGGGSANAQGSPAPVRPADSGIAAVPTAPVPPATQPRPADGGNVAATPTPAPAPSVPPKPADSGMGTASVASVPAPSVPPKPPDSGNVAAPSTPAPSPSVPVGPPGKLFSQGPRHFVSDLEAFDVRSGPWPVSFGGRLGNGKDFVKVNKVLSPNGIGMHPPPAPNYASASYRLGKEAAAFRTTVAIDDTTDWCWSPAVFTVLGDGKPLWQSKTIAHHAPHVRSQECSVDVTGVNVLELRVHVINGNPGVHAVWFEPRVLKSADTPDKK